MEAPRRARVSCCGHDREAAGSVSGKSGSRRVTHERSCERNEGFRDAGDGGDGTFRGGNPEGEKIRWLFSEKMRKSSFEGDSGSWLVGRVCACGA